MRTKSYPVARPSDIPRPANTIDAELQAVVDGWHTLPDAVRRGIVAMVKASAGGNSTQGNASQRRRTGIVAADRLAIR